MKKLDLVGGRVIEDYVHGYATAEQERLLKQAEHWRDELILAGTRLAPGTRLLEVGCGVGAVLGILSAWLSLESYWPVWTSRRANWRRLVAIFAASVWKPIFAKQTRSNFRIRTRLSTMSG